ncbi:MAG: hypothetical protein AAF348_18205 [Bacteroidota bacterium]
MSRVFRIGDFLHRFKRPIDLEPHKKYKLVTIRNHHRGLDLRQEKLGKDIKSKMYLVKEGDFLISGIDARNGSFGIVPSFLNNAIVTNDFWCIGIDESVISKELFLSLTETTWFDELCNKGSDGTTNRVRLQKDRFFNQRINIPDFSSQPKLLETIRQCDDLENKIKESSMHVKKLRQAILKEAFENKSHSVKTIDTLFAKKNYDLDVAIILQQIENRWRINYGEVVTQKTVFHINTFTSHKIPYSFINSNFGTYSPQLKEDLRNNPFLNKISKGKGEVFIIKSTKKQEVKNAIFHSQMKHFISDINRVLDIYELPFINKETDKIELLNSITKLIIDLNTYDLDNIYDAMTNWNIKQDKYKTKADKFSRLDAQKMIRLIKNLEITNSLNVSDH